MKLKLQIPEILLGSMVMPIIKIRTIIELFEIKTAGLPSCYSLCRKSKISNITIQVKYFY